MDDFNFGISMNIICVCGLLLVTILAFIDNKKASEISEDMAQATTEIENIQETEDNDMDIEDEAETDAVETAVIEEQEQDNKIEVKTANGDKYVVSTEQEPVTTSATVAETKTETENSSIYSGLNLEQLTIIFFAIILAVAGCALIFFRLKDLFMFIVGETSSSFFADEYVIFKKIPKKNLKYLFRSINKANKNDPNAEERDVQYYIAQDIDIPPYKLNKNNVHEKFLYNVFTEYYDGNNENGSFWDILDKVLGFATYLYEQIPGCVKGKNVSRVQQKFMQVLEYMINEKLKKLDPEWLKRKKENLHIAIQNCTLPLKVKGNEVRAYLHDYNHTEQGEERTPEEEESNKVVSDQITTGIATVVEAINRALPYVENKEVEKQMKKSKQLLNIIFTMLKQTTAPDDKMKRLLNYYFPTYVKLLNTYCEVKDQYENTEVENVDVLTGEVEETVGTMNHMMLSYLNNKIEKQVWDVQSDISVIKTMLKQDGYTN